MQSLIVRTGIPALAAALLLAACTATGQPGSPPGQAGAPQAAPVTPGGALPPPGGAVSPPSGAAAKLLDQWTAFPVSGSRRPLVLLGEDVRADGYTGGGVAPGVARLETTLPGDGPRRVRIELPGGGSAELPAISARQALDALMQGGLPPADYFAGPVSPLRITNVVLGTASFHTDRGDLTLPAWLFTSPQVRGPMPVPAPAREAFWRPGQHGYRAAVAMLDADGVTLQVRMRAKGPGCPGEPSTPPWTAEVAESATAVVVSLRFPPTPTGLKPCIQPAIGYSAWYKVRLSVPLGDRVVLTAEEGLHAVRRA
ncbi:hypothetical protein ACFQY4_36495 [Catellatospora bangladeshensis]|uniref:GerMN domain-containing protein n=1 Tax=Catellatospora bangladeshensis TaxID=310355 RepID=A0A8J3NK51_9ACTN|nr:hypothetical protein [Catellatospora bangladeshensis]GIF81125.1 hypothetical protein Cba03nite_24740 [Catellatospora bangladeshensis]